MSRFLRFTPALLLALTLFSASVSLAADNTIPAPAGQASATGAFQGRPCGNNAATGAGRHMGRMGMHAAGFGGMHMAQAQNSGYGPHAMATPATR